MLFHPFERLRKNTRAIGPGAVIGIVITSIVTFVVLMAGIMIVSQTDTAAAAVIPNVATDKSNVTYTALIAAVWNAFGLFNIYPIIIAAVGIIMIIGLFMAVKSE
jgi:hypothetical protein